VAYYEWWCPRCRVTHPPGRKVCPHCGGRTQTSRDAAPAFEPAVVFRAPGAAEDAPEPAGDEEAEAPESRAARTARIGMTLVWVALALAATVLRMCREPG